MKYKYNLTKEAIIKYMAELMVLAEKLRLKAIMFSVEFKPYINSIVVFNIYSDKTYYLKYKSDGDSEKIMENYFKTCIEDLKKLLNDE